MPKVALITGSGTGVGRACAIRFAKLGFAVVVNYSKSEADAKETVRLVEAEGVPVLLCKANVADDRQVRGMLAQVKERFGGLDVLVNNAGMTHFISHTDLEALTDAVWDEIFNVNLKGTFYVCRAAMPLLKERKGCIVNVSSVAGQSGLGSSIPYCASKAGVNSLTKSLAKAFGPDVRVNAVSPGPINTRWLAGQPPRTDQSLNLIPLKRIAEPDDVAEAVVYLATGTTLTTGQILVVDGGRTM